MENLNFEKLVTKTGVPLYVMHLPHANSVAAGVLVHSGSRDEKHPDKNGLAHALEHMVSQGTKHFPTSKHLEEYLEEVGGNANAWTGQEGTFFHATVPAEHAERAITYLGEELTTPLFPEEKLRTEMNNIIEEIKMRDDEPSTALYDLSFKQLYGIHPLSNPIVGNRNSVTSFSRNDLVDFWETHYHPSNFTFIAAGNISGNTARTLFEKQFSGISDAPKPMREEIPFRQPKKKLFIINRDIQQVNLAIISILGKGKDMDAMDMYTTMISGGASFPLFQEVRDKNGLCYSIHASVEKFSDVSRFYLYIGTSVENYKKAIDLSVNIIQGSKHDEHLLQKAKQTRLGRFAVYYEEPVNIINFNAEEIMIHGKPLSYVDFVKETNAITIDDITRGADAYLNTDQLYTSIVAPHSLHE